MKEVPLTRGLVAFVDDEDFERAIQFKWCASGKHPGNNHTFYALRNVKKDEQQKRKQILLHRFLMNAPCGLDVDHIDGNGLNNQKSNLRICARMKNMMNQRCWNKNGLKGVVFQSDWKRLKPWQAQITKNGKATNLGRFTNPIDAAITYNIAAVKHFGEFARLNPIPFTYA